SGIFRKAALRMRTSSRLLPQLPHCPPVFECISTAAREGGTQITDPITGNSTVCSVKRVGGTTTNSKSFASKTVAMTSSLGDKGSETLCDSLRDSDGLSIIRLTDQHI